MIQIRERSATVGNRAEQGQQAQPSDIKQQQEQSISDPSGIRDSHQTAPLMAKFTNGAIIPVNSEPPGRDENPCPAKSAVAFPSTYLHSPFVSVALGVQTSTTVPPLNQIGGNALC